MKKKIVSIKNRVESDRSDRSVFLMKPSEIDGFQTHIAFPGKYISCKSLYFGFKIAHVFLATFQYAQAA